MKLPVHLKIENLYIKNTGTSNYFSQRFIVYPSFCNGSCRLAGLLQIETAVRKCSSKGMSLKNLSSCTGKELCRSLFLIKLQALRPVTLLKRDSNKSVFL